ncbi:MAG: DUF308 domain-containing protein [Brachymonas sp.]|nr:DUF308 domain-containing protein [Brachymonas sp.]
MDHSANPYKAEMAKWWWLPLLQGVAALALAAILLFYPLQTLITLTFWLGLYWAIDGTLNFIRALRSHAGQSRMWLLLAGLIGVLSGALMMTHPALASLVSASFMIGLFAASMMLNGFIVMLAGKPSGLSAKRSRSWSSFFIGLLYVLGGALLIANPGMTLLTLIYLYVLWAVVVGLGLIWAAFEIKRQGSA